MNNFNEYTVYKDVMIYCNSASEKAWFMSIIDGTEVYAQTIWDIYTSIDVFLTKTNKTGEVIV